MRKCKYCGNNLDLTEFPKKGGYRCRKCCYLQLKEWRSKNRDYINSSNRRSYQRNKERRTSTQRKLYWNNRDAKLAQKLAYKQTPKGKEVKYKSKLKRRALEYDAYLEPVARSIVFTRDLGICHICKLEVDPNDWHVDHIIPLVRGGKHGYDNVAVAHPGCNLRKHTKIVGEYESVV